MGLSQPALRCDGSSQLVERSGDKVCSKDGRWWQLHCGRETLRTAKRMYPMYELDIGLGRKVMVDTGPVASVTSAILPENLILSGPV